MIVVQVVIVSDLYTCAFVPACINPTLAMKYMSCSCEWGVGQSSDMCESHLEAFGRMEGLGLSNDYNKGPAYPFEIPRKMAESGSSLWTITLLSVSVVPSLHLLSRCRAARGALSSKTSTTRRPAGQAVISLAP